jgi:hypothetical protein
MRVLNLPAKTSWQDLKDYMRTAGEVGYASMVSDSVGVVEYAHKDDFEAALRKLVSGPSPYAPPLLRLFFLSSHTLAPPLTALIPVALCRTAPPSSPALATRR